ncbi:uncharacterized protein SAPINGB_P005557 [Magnusiomyces paraingens]|uniref:Uncharacterized protein n=1 Tax=Magnusiomyces paraingens TaxID=2606893 RepID=A0A5E8C7G2_9ASCO|nr:uncharacterized protein SAPINGB_P005557 [Saprochaete ingens]VVT57146.1 unnamed protein product [Saprochaete ingens]
MLEKPLKDLTVIELSAQAPGPLCGQILADYGARVIRVDRVTSTSNPDRLTRGKESIALNLRHKSGKKVLRRILESDKVDILIDPYRPGVLERFEVLPQHRPAGKKPLIVVRLTGYGQTGKLSKMPGHDINFLAESGVLGIIGPPNEAPTIPANILGVFGALALPAFASIMTTLYALSKDKGESKKPYIIVDVNVVHSLRYLTQYASYLKYGSYPKNPEPEFKNTWDASRGMNVLEGYVCPYYTIYSTKDDGEYVSIGAMEEQFYQQFLELLYGKNVPKLPDRDDSNNWSALRNIFAQEFKKHGIEYWKKKADEYPNSCAVPVRRLATPDEVPQQLVQLDSDKQKGSVRGGYPLVPGKNTTEVLDEFLGISWRTEYGEEFARQSKPKI